MDILTPLKELALLNPGFVQLLDDFHAPARTIIREEFAHFIETDGNFIEQFQTTGFDARVFELFLNAYFRSVGFRIERSSRVDFIIEKNGDEVVVEATTSNANSTRPWLAPKGIEKFKLPSEDTSRIIEQLSEELPIRLGSPLFSKLKKRYWELENCRNKPIVIAIEAFHDGFSLYLPSHRLEEYVYGLRHFPTWTEEGRLVIEAETILEHQAAGKIIPSNFFGQPNTEYISAILFSNSGTLGKFNRMAYQFEHNTQNLKIIRSGLKHDPSPSAVTPLPFSYLVGSGEHVETWGEGLVVCLNPTAKYPLPRHFFTDASCYNRIENGEFRSDVLPFHPYLSLTKVMKV